MEKPKEKHIIFVICGIPLAEIHVHNVNNTQATRRMRECLARAVPVLLFLSTIVCLWVMMWILYNPPSLVKELSESILVNFGKCKTSALEEQLKNAKDRIEDLQREVDKLKREGLANFTREQQILANLSIVEQKNEASLKKVASVPELEQDLEICMREKNEFHESCLGFQKQENDGNKDLANCNNANEKQINDEIKKVRKTESMLIKALKEADESVDELENISKKCQEDLNSMSTEKKAIDEKLKRTNKKLTGCQAKNKDLEQDKDTLNEDLDATKYTLNNCNNKNTDHEVRSLELLQEIKALKRELRAC